MPAVWHPEYVGKVQGYPKTQETFDKKQALMRQQIKLYNAEGITGRNGVPDGWCRKKTLIKQIREASSAEAKVVVDEMEKLGKFVPDNVESRIIMEQALEVVLAEKFTPEQQPTPLYNVKDRLTAMNMIWGKVQKNPISREINAHMSAESFLEALAKE